MTEMTQIDLAKWDEWHSVFAPWCDPAICHSHEVRLNGPDVVNGKPDGPIAELIGYYATTWRARADERQARFRRLVDELLEQARR